MFSLRPSLVLLCALVISGFVGGVLSGCGSSSTATGTGTIETTQNSGQTSDQQTDSQKEGDRETSDDAKPDMNAYATGVVIYPDTTAVPKAYVTTEPNAGLIRADSLGRFRFTEPLPEDEYTFIAEKGEREGKTVVSVPGDRIQKTVWIVVGGGTRSLNAISIDSVRANPGGPGLKRTGN
jgi:hypothetical protein